MKKCYRFFGGLIDSQEKWLNDMAHSGYRLVSTGKLSYTFQECEPDEYQYAVEFIAQLGSKSAKEYRAFLQEMDYRVFYKNANLNFSVGKAKWRPYGKGAGQISTNPGTYNKELLIVEKKSDGEAFELHTTNEDKAEYYKPLRNAWLLFAVLFLALTASQFIANALSRTTAAAGVLGVLSLISCLRYQKLVVFYAAQSDIRE